MSRAQLDALTISKLRKELNEARLEIARLHEDGEEITCPACKVQFKSLSYAEGYEDCRGYMQEWRDNFERSMIQRVDANRRIAEWWQERYEDLAKRVADLHAMQPAPPIIVPIK